MKQRIRRRCANEGCKEANPAILRRCGKCYTVSYCGRECQKKDFPSHKKRCKEATRIISEISEQWLICPQRRPRDAWLCEAFSRGNTATSCFQAGDGELGRWDIRVVHSGVLPRGMDARNASHTGWKRSLNLTLHAGQELPEALFADSSIEIKAPTGSTGVRFSFCALDAMRSWALLNHPPPPHFHEHSKGLKESSHAWDYTFTTAYKGSTDTKPLGAHLPAHPRPCACDSLHSRKAVDLACGKSQLRNPLCKCANSRLLVLQPDTVAKAAASRPSLRSTPPPQWKSVARSSGDGADDVILTLLKNDSRTVAPFFQTVDLWIDNLDPQGMSFLRVSTIATSTFWAVHLRCFVRVNGVMARCIDTKVTCRLDEGIEQGNWVVRREQSWREGSWEEFLGAGSPRYVDFGGVEDRLAFQVLKLVKAPDFEVLILPRQAKEDPADSSLARPTQDLWLRQVRCEATTCGNNDGTMVMVCKNGAEIEAMHAIKNTTIWRGSAPSGTEIVSIALSPKQYDHHNLLALGDDCGHVHLWSASTGEPLTSFAVAAASSGRAVSSGWVEKLAWTSDGKYLAASAGRSAVVVSINRRAASGEVEVNVVNSMVMEPGGCSDKMVSGTISGTAFMVRGVENTQDSAIKCFAFSAYGGIVILRANPESCGGDAEARTLPIGATATLSLAASPDGKTLAVGCLDNRMRIFDPSSEPIDWVGFDGPVKVVAWSASGSWLAATGGTALLVVKRKSQPGEPPIRCLLPNESSNTTFSDLTWCAAHHEPLLAAIEAPSGVTHLFSMLPVHLDSGVPLHAAPILSITAPGSGIPSPLVHVEFAVDESAVALIISCGDWTLARQIIV